jgi:hypothetical protein
MHIAAAASRADRREFRMKFVPIEPDTSSALRWRFPVGTTFSNAA